MRFHCEAANINTNLDQHRQMMASSSTLLGFCLFVWLVVCLFIWLIVRTDKAATLHLNSASICVEGLLTQGLPVPRLQMQSCGPLLRRLRGHGEDGPPVQGGGPAVAEVHAGDMAGALHQTDQGPEDHLQSASTWVVMVLGISFLSFVSPGGYRILQEYLCFLNIFGLIASD